MPLNPILHTWMKYYADDQSTNRMPTEPDKHDMLGFPGHREIQRNEHADRLAKAGLKRKAINPVTSLSYLKRKAKEEILASWRLSSVKVGENHVVLGYGRERPMY
jgi:hypothetical protein